MRDTDIVCKVATRAFQQRLLLFPMPMASCLHFFRLSVTLTHGRKVVAENTFCPELGDYGSVPLESMCAQGSVGGERNFPRCLKMSPSNSRQKFLWRPMTNNDRTIEHCRLSQRGHFRMD